MFSGTDKDVYKTGKKFSVRGVSVIDVRDGKISRCLDFYDVARSCGRWECCPLSNFLGTKSGKDRYDNQGPQQTETPRSSKRSATTPSLIAP